MSGTVVVLSASPDMPHALEIPPGATVIAADGGADHARQLGLRVDLLVGDLDSVSEKTLAECERVERHPVDKEATDLELALSAALELEPERIIVLGGSAGRLDHLFAGILLLASDRYAGSRVDAQFGEATVHVIRGKRRLSGEIGDLISLFAVHGSAMGVRTEGLVYRLSGQTLEPGTSRGVSNVFAETHVVIAVERGVVVAVRPNGIVTVESSDRLRP